MSKKIYLSFILIFFLASDISAQSSRNRKNQKAKPSTVSDILKKYKDQDRGGSVRYDKFTRLIPETAKPRNQVVRNVRAIKPPQSNKFFISGNEKEAQLERLLDEQIDETYKLSQKFRRSPERGEIWLRLGELYVEKAKMVQMRIQDDLDKKIAKWDSQGRKGPAPKVNTKGPQVYNKKAIQLYEWYAKDFPNSRKLDQAFFFLGYNFIEIGQFKKGVDYYKRLTKDFPKSQYVTESYFALAEYYFDNNDWKKAIENYKAVTRNESSRIYPFALYKLAWAHYRNGQPAVAISTLEQVIELSQDSESNRDEGKQVNRIRLGEEAFNDLILFYPDARSYQTALEYFERIGGEQKLYPSLEKLAYLYSDKGQREAARFIFGKLIEMKPRSPKNFDFQFQIVQNYSSGGNRQVYRQELFDWITKYNSRSDWARANPSEVSKSYEQRESTLKNIILQEHRAVQKSRNPTAQKLTKNLYELYVREFGDSQNIGEIRFFFAELLYDMGEFDKASEQYKWVIQNAPDSKYYSASILNEILSLEKSLPDEKELAKLRGESLEPFPLNKEEQAFVFAGDNYTQKFPKEEKVADIKFRIGRIYYSHNYFDDALRYFRNVVKDHPKTPFAKFSANLILDIFNLKKDYQGLTKAGEELLADPSLKSADLSADIKNVVERARFKEAQDLETSKNFKGAASAFEAFSKAYPGSPLAAISRYNAGVNYERAGDLKKATALYATFLATRGNENQKQKKEARRLVSRIYERTGQLEKAAIEFEQLATDYPDDPLTSDLYFNAAVIWSGFKNYPRAIRNYEKFYEKSKKANKVDAIFAIAEIYEKQGRLGPANKTYERFIENNPRDMSLVITAAHRIAINYEKLGQKGNAQEWYRKVVAMRKRAKGDIGEREAAESEFKIASVLVQDLKAIKIPNNPQVQGKAIQDKLAIINRLNAELGKVIKYDVGDYVVASLTTAGDAYEHMYKSIEAVPKPKNLNVEQLKVYDAEVAKITEPLKRQAVDNYKSAIEKARQLDAHNIYSLDALKALNRINGVTQIEEEVELEFMNSKVNL